MIDPCLKTVINDLNVEDMVSFAAFDVFSQVNYNFTDSVDLLELNVDYCGLKLLTFTLPSDSKNKITGVNKGKFHFEPSSST